MSIIIVDQVQPNSGNDLTLDGNVVVTGTLNGAAVNSFTGNTSGNCIQSLWLEHLLGCNGELEIDGNVNVTGNLSASTFYGNGSYLIQDITEITLSGNGPSTATTYLNYGINVITSGDTSNFVARLPLVPIQGRTVTVINSCGISMVLYPSMVGGSINGVVNGAAVIPSDNKAYNFTCYENPAPGSWSGPSIAAAGQYDSGEITFDLTGSTETDVITGIDPMRWAQTSGFYASTSWGHNGLNNPVFIGNSAFKPSVPWNFITQITVYTNMTDSIFTPVFRLMRGSDYNYYNVGGTSNSDFITSTDGLAGSFGQDLGLDSVLSGTPITTGTTTGSTSGFTAHAGEPGTLFGILTYTPAGRPSQIGDIFIQTGTFPYGIGLADQWKSTYISGQLQPWFIGNGIKFRYIIDYI